MPEPRCNIKLSLIIDPLLDTFLERMSERAISDCYQRYLAARGAYPCDDVEPTDEQLAAVRQLISSGMPPYADFSIFGPHGDRSLRNLVVNMYEFLPASGQWAAQGGASLCCCCWHGRRPVASGRLRQRRLRRARAGGS